MKGDGGLVASGGNAFSKKQTAHTYVSHDSGSLSFEDELKVSRLG